MHRQREETQRCPKATFKRRPMLQLWGAQPSCQRMPAAASAKKVPFLPKHLPHGGQLSNQSTAVVTSFSGKIDHLDSRRRGGHEPRLLASRELRLDKGWGIIKSQSRTSYWGAALENNSGFETAEMNVASKTALMSIIYFIISDSNLYYYYYYL